MMMVQASIRATLVVLLVAGILTLLRIHAGGVRHAAWTAVAITMLLMPLLLPWVPAIAIPGSFAPLARGVPSTFPPEPYEPLATRSRENERSTALSPPAATMAGQLRPIGSPVSPDPPTEARWSWIVRVYFFGLVLMLTRLIVGWIGAASLAHRSERRGEFYESSEIHCPVTLGILRPRVLLPATWRSWPPDKLSAVLAHERAHICRRDALVAFVEQVNRCVFWFHPVAWWLSRQIAACAEHACDDAAVRAVDEPRRYAEVLVELAREVRGHGGRLAVAGLPMVARRSLAERIDAILNVVPTRTSVVRRLLLTAGCAAAIALAAACRQQPAPLIPDPAFAAIDTQRRAEAQAMETARALPPEAVQRLRAAWESNPGDLQTLRTLLWHYGPDVTGKKQLDADRRIAARRQLILWLVEHKPGDQLARSLEARIFATGRDWLPDPEGFDAGRKLWLAHVSKTNADRQVLMNAAWWLNVDDKPLTEEILLKGRTLAPDPEWSRRLGVLYAQAIAGSNGFTLFNVIRSSSPEEAKSAFAMKARRTLADTEDAVLLGAAGGYLIDSARNANVDFDPRALGRSYVDRAVAIDPNEESGRLAKMRYEATERHNRLYESLQGRPHEEWPELVQRTPEADRLELLVELMTREYMGAEGIERSTKDLAAGRAARARSKQYAENALAFAAARPNDPNASAAVYQARVALGLHALRDGDRKRAVRYMLDAVDVTPSDALNRANPGLEQRLVNYLLKEGERESVIAFLERSAALRPGRVGDSMRRSAEAIRKGVMPPSYQATFERGT